MRVCVLGSGSAGNCTYISTSTTRVLIDLGFGRRSLERRMRQAGLDARRLDAVLLTHGHSDHARGIPALVGRRRIPVFMNEGTRQENAGLEEIDRWEPFSVHRPFAVGDIEIEAFPVPHDAAQPVGFRFLAGGLSGAQVTDLGELTPSVVDKISGCDWLVLESNHDEEMVRIGPYPWPLKQRVLSRQGHLSNQLVSDFLARRFDGRASNVFLAHLSRQNNDPEIALNAARDGLQRSSALFSRGCSLHLTHQDRPSAVLSLDAP